MGFNPCSTSALPYFNPGRRESGWAPVLCFFREGKHTFLRFQTLRSPRFPSLRSGNARGQALRVTCSQTSNDESSPSDS
jgi:hypothetical protein